MFDKQIFENSQTGYSSLASNIWMDYFTLFELTEIMRQKDDKQFAEVVQNLRRQFPLGPAAAKTIHRCQGDTLDEAVVDFPASAREHMHYVGFSQVRNSSALHILNLNENKIKVSDKVNNELSRRRTHATMAPLAVLQNTDLQDSLFILFQNVRSLHLHIDDVQSDYNIIKADVNIFIETTLCSLDRDVTYELTGCTLYRNDYTQTNIRTYMLWNCPLHKESFALYRNAIQNELK